MNYADFELRYQEIRRAISHAAGWRGEERVAEDPVALALAYQDEDALRKAVNRTYRISARVELSVHFEVRTAIWARVDGIAAYPTDILMNFTPEELHVAANVKQVIAQYEAGQIDQMPPSGPWFVAAQAPLRPWTHINTEYNWERWLQKNNHRPLPHPSPPFLVKFAAVYSELPTIHSSIVDFVSCDDAEKLLRTIR